MWTKYLSWLILSVSIMKLLLHPFLVSSAVQFPQMVTYFSLFGTVASSHCPERQTSYLLQSHRPLITPMVHWSLTSRKIVWLSNFLIVLPAVISSKYLTNLALMRVAIYLLVFVKEFYFIQPVSFSVTACFKDQTKLHFLFCEVTSDPPRPWEKLHKKQDANKNSSKRDILHVVLVDKIEFCTNTIS